ncbi:MAG: cyanophycin synthetase, partial [Polyangiales bacterium]
TSAGRFSLGIFGVHNVGNALAAIALAAEMLQVRVRDVAPRLASFRGVARRQQRLLAAGSSSRGVTLYDDFAHHPTAVDATLRSLRERHRKARLVAVYEPRSATACRAMHQEAYVGSFAAADVVVLAPLGRSTIPENERLDLEKLAAALRAGGKHVDLAPTYDDVVELTVAHAQSTAREQATVVVAMSNGSFGGVTARLQERLA